MTERKSAVRRSQDTLLAAEYRRLTWYAPAVVIPHNLGHALYPERCDHNMAHINQCVICGKWLKADRDHVDTCGEGCFHVLLNYQRRECA